MAETGKSIIARVVTPELHISEHLESPDWTIMTLGGSGGRHVLLGSFMFLAGWD